MDGFGFIGRIELDGRGRVWGFLVGVSCGVWGEVGGVFVIWG